MVNRGTSLIFVLMMAAILRNVQVLHRVQWRAGDVVRIKATAPEVIPEKWGKQWVVHEGIWIDIPPHIRLYSGEKFTTVGTLETRLIHETPVGFKLIIRDFVKNSRLNTQESSKKSLRKHLVERYLRWLPGDEGALAAGILIGGDEGWSQDGAAAFRKAGLSHVVAASGFNVQLVAAWVVGIWWRVGGRRWAVVVGIASVWGYAALAAWSVPVIRAALMSSLVMMALLWGHKAYAGRALIISALLMLIWRPEWITDIGFQLSVAATGSLIWLEPVLPGWLPTDLRTSLAAIWGTLPLLVHHFGTVSVAAPLTNALLLWPVPIIMQIGIIAGMVGLVWNEAGQLIMWLTWPLVWLMTHGARWAASHTWATWEVGEMGWSGVAAAYSAFYALILRWRLHHEAMDY